MMKGTRRAVTFAAALAAAALISSPFLSIAGAKDKKASPMSPEDTVESFTVAPGLKATVWAHEPDLVKPTNMDIDSRGRVWITEAANYRSSKTRPEGDRVMILEDTKHTGVCDSSKVFVQSPDLFAPLGICVMGNKVYVAQSPNMLIYTIDETGDKPVGPPQVVLTGFAGSNHDHGLHSGIFGPDGRFYFNCGNYGEMDGYVKFGPAVSQRDGKPVTDVLGTELGSGFKNGPRARAQKGRGISRRTGHVCESRRLRL